MARDWPHFSLFREELDDLEETRISHADAKHKNRAIEKMPDISKEDFLSEGMDHIGLEIPGFDFNRIEKEITGETGRETLRYRLYVNGDPTLLRYDPDVKEIEPMEIALEDSWFAWDVDLDGQKQAEVEEEIEQKERHLKKGLDELEPILRSINQKIENELESVYEDRMEKCSENKRSVEDLDIEHPTDS